MSLISALSLVLRGVNAVQTAKHRQTTMDMQRRKMELQEKKLNLEESRIKKTKNVASVDDVKKQILN